ncbi:MAG: carboxypeptidase-like regulatory domain-containing protein [Bacteroidales bacterium]|jgi:hypothetical protein
MKSNILLIFIPLLASQLFFSRIYGQNLTINGYVQDSITGEKLIGANIFGIKTNRGTTSNQFGFFSILMPRGKTEQLSVSYVGYHTQSIYFNGSGDTLLVVKLNLNKEIKEVTIIGLNKQNPLIGRSFGMISLNAATIAKLPTLTGIRDIMRSSQLLPGIQSGKEGSSQIYIRGGSSDQNLILLDDIPVYYVNHIGGFISVLDAGAINSVQIFKGGFPARYGGRLSGIVDIRIKEGSKSQASKGLGKYTLQLGLFSTEYKKEGPIKPDTSSYLISIRRCNVDLLTRLFSLMQSDGQFQAGYTFYDFTGKYSRNLGPRDKLFFTTYFGRDKIFATGATNSYDGLYRNRGSFITKWGNLITSAKWTHIYANSLFGSLTVAYSRFVYNKSLSSQSTRFADGAKSSYDLSFGSNIQDVLVNYNFEKNLNSRHHLNFGIQNTFHLFKPYNYSVSIDSSSTPAITYSSKQFSPESRAYFEDNFDLSEKWRISAGAQLACIYSDTRLYWALEPRLSSTYALNDKLKLNIGYSRMTQNLHLLSSSGLGLPTDLWIPVTSKIPPGVSDQIGLGMDWQLPANLPFHITVEAYYKKMKNLAEFKEGSVFFQNGTDWQLSVETGGTGISRGIELLIEKPQGMLTGWIGYTLSKHERTFPGLNGGRTFPFRYDRTHDLSVVANFEINQRINLCATWVYWTGEAVTLAYGQYMIPIGYDAGERDDEIAHAYSSRNGYRLPDYHRLDIAIQFKRSFLRADRVISFGVYNVYNRKNPFFLFWDKGSDGAMKLYQVTIFPIMPNISATYTFK